MYGSLDLSCFLEVHVEIGDGGVVVDVLADFAEEMSCLADSREW
jgi:hypothetical protein